MSIKEIIKNFATGEKYLKIRNLCVMPSKYKTILVLDDNIILEKDNKNNTITIYPPGENTLQNQKGWNTYMKRINECFHACNLSWTIYQGKEEMFIIDGEGNCLTLKEIWNKPLKQETCIKKED